MSHKNRTKAAGFNRPSAKRKGGPPKTPEHYFARGERFQDTWTRVTDVIAKMRSKGFSLTKAASEVGVSTESVKRWGRTALRKKSDGHYVATKSDRLLRVLRTPSPTGPREIPTRSSRLATIISQHATALGKYAGTGEGADLQKFANVYVTDVNGERLPLLTDLAEIDRLAAAGVLSYEGLYSRR